MENQAELERLRNRVAYLEDIIRHVTQEDGDSLASRYIKERLDNINSPNVERIGRQEMLEQVISLIYEHYFMYNRNFHGKDSDRTLQMRNLIHDLREIQAQEMSA